MAPPRHRDRIGRYDILDVRDMARAGALRPNAVAISRLATFQIIHGSLRVLYSVQQGDRWEPVTFWVSLAYTRCNYGGSRPWFICGCGRKAARLYFSPMLRCRRCLNLSYPCQSEGKMDRAMRQEGKLRYRLGGTGRVGEPIPTRPRYMHATKYHRLAVEVGRFSDRWMDAMKPMLRRLGWHEPIA